MTTVGYLIGAWSCTHTAGDFSGRYTETFAPSVDNRWLVQSYAFPATKDEPAVNAQYFLEYDPRASRWVRFGAHSNGQYYGMSSTSAGDAGWAWEYVLPSAGATAVWTKRSATEYTIDGPQYVRNGTTVTEHHDCVKLPATG